MFGGISPRATAAAFSSASFLAAASLPASLALAAAEASARTFNHAFAISSVPNSFRVNGRPARAIAFVTTDFD